MIVMAFKVRNREDCVHGVLLVPRSSAPSADPCGEAADNDNNWQWQAMYFVLVEGTKEVPLLALSF